MRSGNPIVLALIAIIMWSTAGTAFKLALRHLEFSQLLFIAAQVAWMTLALVSLIQKKKWFFSWKGILRSALNGFLNPFLYYLILLKAYSLLPAQIAQPLNYSWPIMLVILSVLFLKHRLKWFDLVGIALSFTGVIVISMMGDINFQMNRTSLVGIVLATGSSIIWAGYWILNVKDKRDELNKLTLNFIFGALFISIWILSSNNLPSFSTGWIPAIYVGLTEMAIAFVCWLVALQASKNHARISNLVFISPFLALIFIHLILKEQIFISTIIGLILIVGGILFQQFLVANERKKA